MYTEAPVAKWSGIELTVVMAEMMCEMRLEMEEADDTSPGELS